MYCEKIFAAFGQLVEKLSGSAIVGKTPVFQVDMSVLDEKNIKIGGNVGVTLYFLGPAKLNTNDAIKVNREGQFAKGSIWRTICIGSYIFIGVTE